MNILYVDNGKLGYVGFNDISKKKISVKVYKHGISIGESIGGEEAVFESLNDTELYKFLVSLPFTYDCFTQIDGRYIQNFANKAYTLSEMLSE